MRVRNIIAEVRIKSKPVIFGFGHEERGDGSAKGREGWRICRIDLQWMTLGLMSVRCA
jgi:hypothetical protein